LELSGRYYRKEEPEEFLLEEKCREDVLQSVTIKEY
jgi:hypothetical protein